jgi:serine/threonine protein kinase
MANIYKAIQLSLDRVIALKVMHAHLAFDEGFVARFEKEAKQAAQLQHENIVSIIDYGVEQGSYYIAMEYVDGKNLKEILTVQDRLPLEMCLLICHQIIEGLKFAHSFNLVHRDIKPANVILSNDGRVLLTDFGIAKASDDLTITATGQMIGSPAFMSPEQAAGKPTDHRSDIFSMGIILYEMLAGEKPFNGETYQEMVASIMSADPKPLKSVRVDVNDEIENIVKNAMVKDMDSRYQSAEQFGDHVYKELSKYKLPNYKKLISTYLSDPLRTTEKLRQEKISNHMESAMYYVTQGEGRLVEAKRQFKEVLRFDKDNKSAKEYLQKLESQSATGLRPQLNQKSKLKKWRYLIGGAITVVTAVLIMALLGVFSSDDSTIVKANRDHNSSINDKPGDTKNAGTGNNKPIVKSEEPKAKPPVSAKTTNPVKNNKPVLKDSKPTSTKPASIGFNYPNQDLSEFGYLTIKTNTPAEVYIDQILYGLSNGPAIKVAPGRHFIELKADGYRRMTRRLFTDKDKSQEIKINLIADR